MSPILHTLILDEAERRQQVERKREPWHAGWEQPTTSASATRRPHVGQQFLSRWTSNLLDWIVPAKPVLEL